MTMIEVIDQDDREGRTTQLQCHILWNSDLQGVNLQMHHTANFKRNIYIWVMARFGGRTHCEGSR